MAWTCPLCARQFRRRGQSHECAPAMTLDEYFSTGPERERPIFEAVMAQLAEVGPVHVEPVSVGIFLKRAQTFAELRPKMRWEELSFSLPRVVSHERITAKPMEYHGRYYHRLRVFAPDDIDDGVGAWLVEAYLASPE